MSRCALIQEGQEQQASVERSSQTTYCAKASARGNAPLPSFPRKSRAWLRRLPFTNSTSRCFTAACPITFLNDIPAKVNKRDRPESFRAGPIGFAVIV